MSKRISGIDFHIDFHGLSVKTESANLSITDNGTVAMTQGRPNGYVDGDVMANGDFVFDTQNINLILEAARRVGSFKALEPFDILFYAQTADRMKVEAFGCKLKIDDLLSIDSKGGEKITHKVGFDVTGSDFININGVPYLDVIN